MRTDDDHVGTALGGCSDDGMRRIADLAHRVGSGQVGGHRHLVGLTFGEIDRPVILVGRLLEHQRRTGHTRCRDRHRVGHAPGHRGSGPHEPAGVGDADDRVVRGIAEQVTGGAGGIDRHLGVVGCDQDMCHARVFPVEDAGTHGRAARSPLVPTVASPVPAPSCRVVSCVSSCRVRLVAFVAPLVRGTSRA